METATSEFDEVLNAFCPGEGARDNSCSSASALAKTGDKTGALKELAKLPHKELEQALFEMGHPAPFNTKTKKEALKRAEQIVEHLTPAGQERAAKRQELSKLQQEHHEVKRLDEHFKSDVMSDKSKTDAEELHGITREGVAKRRAELEAEIGKRQANNVENFEQLVANLSAKPQRRTLDGREYLVAPITIFPPGGGVMNGSKGALYYSDSTCLSRPGAWNDVPITGRHPVRNGKHVSVAGVDDQRIGFLANDRVEDGRRRVTGWLDVENAREYDRRNGTAILPDWEAGRLLEVSTGLLTDDRPVANGTHNGRAYAREVVGWTPDHLAVLPDQKGACSISDGCGVNNAEIGKDVEVTPALRERLKQFLGGAIRLLTGNADHDDPEYHCAECEGKPESEHCDKCKEMAENAFCATGEGGGVDPSCGGKGSGSTDHTKPGSVAKYKGRRVRVLGPGGVGKTPEAIEKATHTWVQDTGGGKRQYVPKSALSPVDNVRSLNTGKFKRTGSGYGKGETHEAAQRGAMTLTARDRELGADAYRQLQETGSNPASWVADEATWEKAKAAADKGGYGEGDAYWAVVAHIYKNMGGEVKGTENEFNEVVNAFCPGEGARDNSCSSNTTGDKDAEPLLKQSSLRTYGTDLVIWRHGVGESTDKYSFAKKGEQQAKDAPQFASQKEAEQAARRYFKGAVSQRGNKANNQSGNPGSTFNEGDSPMLTEKQRKTIVTELATNCECWRGEAETLNEMSDEQLLRHAKSHKTAKADALVANAVKDEFEVPDDIAANEMPAFIKKKMMGEKGEEETADDEEDEEVENSDVINALRSGKRLTEKQFTAIAPSEMLERDKLAQRVLANEKRKIVDRLVANVADPKRKVAKRAELLKRDIDTLNEMAELLLPVQTANEDEGEPYFILGGGRPRRPTANADDDDAVEQDITDMTPPTINVEELKKDFDKRRAAV